jgi:aldose 1-epimerase
MDLSTFAEWAVASIRLRVLSATVSPNRQGMIGMAIAERAFGEGQGKAFAISAGAYAIEVTEYGARLRTCIVPDAEGVLADVVPGFDTPADYVERGGSTGAICGRYGNRIANGQFELDGVTLQLSVNEPPNCLHGGFKHFGKHYWTGTAMPAQNAVRLTHFSPDGDEGWPGNLSVAVTYRLTAAGLLTVEMEATTDKATYVNLIHHGYWNLAGHAAGLIDGHLLQVAAARMLPKDAHNVPTGETAPVAGTAFDFRALRAVGRDVAGLPGGGYDHNWCLDAGADAVAVRLIDPISGRTLALSTDQPGVQIFTANAWKDVRGKDGAVYQARAGIAFETQLYPNAPNTPGFDPVPLRPGDVYRHRMAIQFGALGADELRAVRAGVS